MGLSRVTELAWDVRYSRRAFIGRARRAPLGLYVMVDRFDLVVLRITQERGVVVGMIVPWPRRTVVGSSGREPGGVKRVNLRNGRSPEAPVTARIGGCVRGLVNAEIRMAIIIRTVPLPKTDGVGSFVGDDRAKSGHDT